MNELLNPAHWQVSGITAAATLFLQTTAVLVVAIGAAWVLRGRGPILRSAILRAGLAVVVLGPLAAVVLGVLGVPGLRVIPRTYTSIRSAQPVDSHDVPIAIGASHEIQVQRKPTLPREIATEHPAAADTSAQTHRTPVVAVTLQSPHSATAKPETQKADWIDRAIVGLWALLAGLLLLRLLFANVRVAILRRRSKPAPVEAQSKCRAIARQLRVSAPPILLSDGISGPCVVGWIRPVILLPRHPELVEREILIHELAHLARRDCAWQFVAQLAAALLWFQPLIWILSREMERAAEEACDDRVIALGGNRGTYVRTLADLAEKAQRRFGLAPISVGVVGMKSAMGRRVARLLDSTKPSTTHLVWRVRSSIALCAVVLIAGLATLRPAGRALADSTGSKTTATAGKHIGRVVDADGKPVAGAEVLLVENKVFERPVLEATRSDAQGNFSLKYDHKSVPDKWIELQAYAPGRGVNYKTYDPADLGEIRLKPTTSITLTMTAPDAKPLAGLHVYPRAIVSMRIADGGVQPSFWALEPAQQIAQSMGGTTAADGTVTLRDLPRGAKLGIGFADDRFAYPTVVQRLELSPTEPISNPAHVQLEPGATISGMVRYGPTGTPAAGVEVYAQNTNRSYSRGGGGGATTDDQGRFRITHLVANEYNIMLSLRDGMEKDWTAAAHEWVNLESGASLTGIDFTLIKGGIVTGKVTMADTGQPIADVRVGSQGPDHPRSSASIQGVRVSADGTYSLRVPPGTQYVYVQGPLPPAYRQDKQDIREVQVADGQTATLDFKVPRRDGVPVNGTVIGLDGKPVAGITVRALINPRGFEAFAYATSDARGRFHFDSIPNTSPLSVRDGQWGTAESVYFNQGKEVRIQLIRRVKLTLPGLVTDEQGKPIAGARVRVIETIAVMGMSRGDPIITGPLGRYEIPDLNTDSNYNIAADAEGFGEAQSRLSLNPGTRELPTLVLPRADATVGGRVVDETGKALAGITVHLNNGMSPKTTVTDKDGRFSFKIVPGTHHLIWIAVKTPGKVGPNANGSAGRDDIKLVLPSHER
ncbi:MAG TPA: carboxypeptidase regulatory-like domain-containing protein [Tepidisphaeraceae bacterium]|nr:carboxypeptidase regulatory-like domain-containing protein [Tepidisphaeraceae bacterium]